jgi:hypothetical protein
MHAQAGSVSIPCYIRAESYLVDPSTQWATCGALPEYDVLGPPRSAVITLTNQLLAANCGQLTLTDLNITGSLSNYLIQIAGTNPATPAGNMWNFSIINTTISNTSGTAGDIHVYDIDNVLIAGNTLTVAIRLRWGPCDNVGFTYDYTPALWDQCRAEHVRLDRPHGR